MSDYREQHEEHNLQRAADRTDRERDVDELFAQHREGEADLASFIEEISAERAEAERAELERTERLTAAERARSYTERVNRPRPSRGGGI